MGRAARAGDDHLQPAIARAGGVLEQQVGGAMRRDDAHLVRHAEPHPFIIVLPDGGTSAYLDLAVMPDPESSLGLQRYERFLMDDLWRHVTATFRVRGILTGSQLRSR